MFLPSQLRDFADNFRPGAGAKSFFVSILVWGVGVGCFTAVLNNYLVDIHHISEQERGFIEFFRETPGLLLVVLLALLHKKSEWNILRIGTAVSMAAAICLLVPGRLWFVTLLITLWSTGEHLIMPVRYSIAMHVAKPGKSGASLGILTGTMNVGTVAGSILVALLFSLGMMFFGAESKPMLYNVVWVMIAVLLAASLASTVGRRPHEEIAQRPRLYFNRKYWRYYVLELFYGARKQIFLTFAPLMLVKIYRLEPNQMALLFAVCAGVNIFCGPLIGKITDRFGYKNIMIYDTVILFFVCLLYGFAGDWFPAGVAVWVLCANFLLDAVISTTSLATNIYVREISSSPQELTSTLSTGISINHLISVSAAVAGGLAWAHFGVETLFIFAGCMAILNSLFALTLPRPRRA